MNSNETLREILHESISRNKGEKYRIKVKTLLGQFGYSAQQRVRQSSISAVFETLDEWGIEVQFTGQSANDYLTLKRREGEPSGPISGQDALASSAGLFDITVNPFTFALHIGNRLEDEHSMIKAEDLFAAVWSYSVPL